MGKSLVIVESPAKARTINRYLGDDYVVASSVGHIRDLPRGAIKTATRAVKKPAQKLNPKEKLYRRMGIDPTRNWEANYVILEEKAKIVKELSRLAKQSDAVYLATDMDREGEAIAWHLTQVLDSGQGRGRTQGLQFKRVIFNEITQNAIRAAFEDPGMINIDRVNAQQARRFLDRVVGFMLSPLLWEKVARNLSAGRVQSVATRLVVERENEINAFVPEEYWEVYAHTQTENSDALRLQVKKCLGKAFRPNNAKDTEKALLALKALAPYTLSKRTDKAGQTRPPPPFITSTLQQAASARFGFSVKKTMFLAQRLYEMGHISYMRTDSTHLSADAVNHCRTYIKKEFGTKYLPKTPNTYTSTSNAQEAHEAIRPTRVTVRAEQIHIPKADRDAARLYELIWRQFVACQMPPMRYNTTSMIVVAGDYELRASGRVIVFDGFTKVLVPIQRKGDREKTNPSLPDIQEGHVLQLLEIEKNQHFTRPPARYSEATLVKEMEKLGIGRPSTYASVISTIQERGYVSVHNKRMHAEKIGAIVTNRLMENFQDLMDYNFTASMEQSLDKIAQGESKWKNVLDEFYQDFDAKLEDAKLNMRSNNPILVDAVLCPTCERPMALRTGRTGMFLGCSGYDNKSTERCTKTMDLISDDKKDVPESGSVDDTHAQEENTRLLEGRRCKACNTLMSPYRLDTKRRLHVCGNMPDCEHVELETGQFKGVAGIGIELECDRCGAPMELKSGRYGRYFACTASECGNTRKVLASGEPAPPKMKPVPMPELRCQKEDDYYLLRDGASGLFLAASEFPRKRETRSPLVEELIPHRDEIDPKYHYLLDGPTEDKDGNKTEIRYSRKTQEQYLSSVKDGAPTGWQAFHQNGTWHERQVKVRRRPG